MSEQKQTTWKDIIIPFILIALFFGVIAFMGSDVANEEDELF